MDLTVRSSDDSIQKKKEVILSGLINSTGFNDILNSLFDVVIILDENRQIVYANKVLFKLLGMKDEKWVLGKRPGEILNCIHAEENKTGCGTTEFCEECGALQAIISSLGGREDVKECHITVSKTGLAIDLAVSTTPLNIESQKFVVASIIDISDKKRRESLEHIFFHDVLNVAGVILNIADLIKDAKPELIKEKNLGKKIYNASKRLIDEIESQRMLAYSESNELRPNFDNINLLEHIRDITDTMLNNSVAEGKYIKLNEDCKDVKLKTDRVMFQRIIGNMVKNALEASNKGDAVSVGYRCEGNNILFYVNNRGFIPLEVQHQMFQRSFSTKGAGRGLGTYSSKLLSEKYLNGKIWFESNIESGTTFYFSHPV